MKKVVIIGSGVAAHSAAFYLKQNRDLEITLIANEAMAPTCSLNSTAIVAARGVQEGISPLGDINHKSYQEFVAFVQKYKPQGIEEIQHHQCWRKDYFQAPQWSKRFGPSQTVNHFLDFKLNQKVEMIKEVAFMIYPKTFLNWFDNQVINDFIRTIKKEKKIILTGMNQNYQADMVVMTTGAYGPWLHNHESLQKSKPIQGCYLDMPFEYAESFSITYEKIHLVYRAQEQRLLLGSTKKDCGFQFLADEKELREYYDEAKNLFPDLDLPPYSAENIKVGLRQKGIKRMPFWGQLEENIYSIHSLYRNGWSYSLLGARELAQIILNK